jgi:hypothetical protein
MANANWVGLTVSGFGETPKGRKILKAVNRRDGLLVGNDFGALPAVGQVIEVEVTESSFNGRVNYWANSWRRSDAAPEAPSATNGAGPTPDAHLRFISNVVGQAILAKTITSPDQILEWAKAAGGALSALES